MRKEKKISPSQAPSGAELLARPEIQTALRQAWIDSLPGDSANRHEEGGWIYLDTTTGTITVLRAPAGGQSTLDLRNPPLLAGFVVVATFHTHPNPTAEGWSSGPSGFDELSADALGVPCLIRADDGDYTVGPDKKARRVDGRSWLSCVKVQEGDSNECSDNPKQCYRPSNLVR